MEGAAEGILQGSGGGFFPLSGSSGVHSAGIERELGSLGARRVRPPSPSSDSSNEEVLFPSADPHQGVSVSVCPSVCLSRYLVEV